MCADANQLRLAWWATVERLPLMDEAGLWKVILQREMPEYQRALERLRRHLETCQVCRKELWGETPSPALPRLQANRGGG